MKYAVQIESEVGVDGTKKAYDIFSNLHTEPLRIGPPHIHSYYEVTTVLEGELVYRVGNEEDIRLHTGDIIFVPPYVVHNSSVLPAERVQMRSSVVKFSPLFLYPMETTRSDVDCLLMAPTFEKPYYLFRAEDEKNLELDAILQRILHERSQAKLGYELALRGELIRLYIYLIRSCAVQEQPCDPNDREIDESSAQKLHQILTYLKENYQYNLSMKEVADICGMSYSSFSRFFKKVTNRNFNEYLLEMRLNYAQKKLLQSEESITNIAMECGFDYTSYFIKQFKKKNGITPKEYQKKYQ